MSSYINIKYRIKRNAEQQAMMKKLNDAKVLESYRDILMLSAIIAYNCGVYTEIKKLASDRVQMVNFTESDYNFFDLLAFAHTKDTKILESDEKYDIFANYANAGFPILIDKLGIDENTNITPQVARKLMHSIYKLVLTNGFVPNINDAESEIII